MYPEEAKFIISPPLLLIVEHIRQLMQQLCSYVYMYLFATSIFLN